MRVDKPLYPVGIFNMKLIPLGGKYGIGKFALVDDEDYDYLMQWKWQGKKWKNDNTIYAARTVHKSKKFNITKDSWTSIHRTVMKCTPFDGVIIDHKDGNGLNNQKNNLRFCTQTQNQRNRKCKKQKSSLYKGVSYRSDNDQWRAYICVDTKTINLGQFKKQEDAAMAYDLAAKKYFGEFANLNFRQE